MPTGQLLGCTLYLQTADERRRKKVFRLKPNDFNAQFLKFVLGEVALCFERPPQFSLQIRRQVGHNFIPCSCHLRPKEWIVLQCALVLKEICIAQKVLHE
ncbi:MAG: hypothetical protein IPL70_15695 [Uliginosibacterium sp.]|nr:hypothetical protein [Uliginosibacterium sp.]